MYQGGLFFIYLLSFLHGTCSLSPNFGVNFFFDDMVGNYCCCSGNPDELTGISDLFITIDRVGATTPSNSVFLAGKYDDFNRAELNVSSPAALNTDLLNATGNFSLNVFTSTAVNYTAGIWFIKDQAGVMMPALTLPSLPSGWIYEGWIEQQGQPVSLGTFRTANERDSNGPGPFAGANVSAAPAFPGEEFVTSPRNLTVNTTVYVTVEPFPDNDPSTPFALTALFANVGLPKGPYPELQELFSFGFANPHGASQVTLADVNTVEIYIEVVGFELLNSGYEYHIWATTNKNETLPVGSFNEEGNTQLKYFVTLPVDSMVN